MARGVNKCIFIGNLTRDPEMRYMPDGKAIASFPIAVNESWKDKNGEKQERAEFVNITMFGKLAEIAGQYLKKGEQVYIEGSLRTEKYTDKQTGVEKYATKIIASEMLMLGGNSGGTPRQQAKPTIREPGEDDEPFNDDF